jgi:TetR/AcrR family transcriptional repressor of nem operon
LAKSLIHKDDILGEAYLLFKQKGYHKTSIGDIAKACGIYKSNIYHYFTNKEDIMLEVLNKTEERAFLNIHNILLDKSLTPKERMEKYLDKVQEINLTSGAGCLFGNIGLETKLQNIQIKRKISSYFDRWVNLAATYFTEIMPVELAQDRAKRFVPELEGAIMFSTVNDDPQYFISMKKNILSSM